MGVPYHRQMSEYDIQRKELMNKFDDIPIKELNKQEAYQQKRFDEQEDYDNSHNNNGGNANNVEEKDESNMTLYERVEHPKWKIRMNAYKEINSLFYNEYSKDCVKS